ncbi:MAG: hypothetical protein HYV16_01460 [Gammaproteobacteria bacterium]|nr:hypothetical protein [Gammaproteobacteria bacterium]
MQLTPAIRAKAAELGKDPVKTYNWVHNSIRFVPRHGAIQGAAYTLETRWRNAFDTTSLLIRGLRSESGP